ncbi:MAG: NAD(P)H-dependent glycerol-3-phosphate dehydrogenase [Gemmobacter sp.]
MTVAAVIGAGAFGAALAAALADRGEVWLIGRDIAGWRAARRPPRLPDLKLPEGVVLAEALPPDLGSEVPVLMAVPMAATVAAVAAHGAHLGGRVLIACAKGIDPQTGLGAGSLIGRLVPVSVPAVLTGPSFAADIARGLPTALARALGDGPRAEAVQARLATPVLRIYRGTDLRGAELGGALKNVVAIGAGLAIGAGMGESARAALMTRGHAEMVRIAVASGARAATLHGLAGLGDLVLTCTSAQSRNFAHGAAIGAGTLPAAGRTIEGIAPAAAAVALAARLGVRAPVMGAVAAVLGGRATVAEAMAALMARPLRSEED